MSPLTPPSRSPRVGPLSPFFPPSEPDASARHELADCVRVSPSLIVVRLRLARALGQAFRVDLADLLEGAGQRVQVPGSLVPSLPQTEDDPGRTALISEI